MDGNNDYTGTIEAYDMSYLTSSEEDLILDIVSTSFNKSHIDLLRSQLGDLVKSGVIDQHNMVKFRRALGVRGHLMDLSLGDSTLPTLNHYSCLLSYAEELMEKGHLIHLIEATDCNKRKKMADIDLLSSKNEEIYLHDYTQIKLPDDHYGFVVLSSDEQSEKYTKLHGKFMQPVNAVVVTGRRDTSLDMITISVEVYKGSPYDDDMDFYDSVMDVLPDMTIKQAEEIVGDYADRAFAKASYSGSEYLSSAPKCKSFFESNKDSLVDLLKHNNPESGKKLDEFHDSLTSEEASRDYFHDYYEKVLDCEEKPIFLHHLPGRITEYNLSAYDRLNQIKKDLGASCSTFIDLILLTSDNGDVHPSDAEKAILKKGPDYDYIKDLNVQRLTRKKFGTKGELMSAIRLWYRPSLKKTMRDFIFNKNRHEIFKESRVKHESAEEVEKAFLTTADALCEPCEPSRFSEDLTTLSKGIMTGEGMSVQIKDYVKAMLHEASAIKIGSYLSFLTEMTIAMSNAQRRKHSCESVQGSIKSNQMVFSLDAVSDRTCVVLTGMNLKLGEIGDQAYCTIQSNSTEMPGGLTNLNGNSRWSNMSSEDTNWYLVLYHKYLSWVSYVLESNISVTGKFKKQDLKDHVVMPAMMMLINSLGFAQTSEAIRYLFLSSVGMSTDQYKIIEKIEWYNPDSLVEKIYIVRMIKMINFLGLAKSNNVQASLYVHSTSNVSFSTKEHGKSKFRSLTIAFPNESTYVLRDDHSYNMFYICRAFQIDRQGELLGEALVVEKQKEAREDYIKVKSKNNPHEARFRKPVSSVLDLIKMCKEEEYCSRNTDVYSPNALVVILGYLVTLLKYKASTDKKVGHVSKRVYNIDDRDQFTELSGIMNNRGSLRRSGPEGVVKIRDESRIVDDKRMMVSINQNSKSYETLLQLAHDYKTNVSLPKTKPFPHRYNSSKDVPVTRSLTELQLLELCDLPDNLSAVQMYCISERSLFVSKGTHKGDVAVREIATLNAAAKTCCKIAEDFARSVRDNEHGQGDDTNLIEIKDKDEKFKNAYIKSLHVKDPETTLHDSADCSKWGPGMLSPTLYFVVASRMKNKAKRNMLRNFFFLFSQRIFKLPDRLYSFAINKDKIVGGSNSKVERICTWIRENKDLELCDTENQYFKLEEGMYQGILGNCSSCLAADAARLNEFSQSRLMKDLNFRSMTKVTSDDYNRSCVFTLGARSLSEVVRYTTGITMINQSNFGIRRNKYKSTMSTRRSELNSKYMDETGDYKPDIKSRLSYVDYDHGNDLVPSAIRASTLSAEYLRAEGSLIGAIITQLLNTHLHFLKHGIRPLLRSLGNDIFNVPLELGGLIRIDPVLAVSSSEYVSVIDNYSLGTSDPEMAIKFLDEMTPKEVSSMTLDDDDSSLKSMVPRMSRSGVVHLASKEKRTLRSIREMVGNIPNEWFCMLKYPGNPSLLKAIISCIKREDSNADSSVRSKSFSACQTNQNAILYRLNSPFLISKFDKKTVSRKMLFSLAESILLENPIDISREITSKPINLPFDLKDMATTLRDYKDYIKKSTITDIGCVKIKTSIHRNRVDFFPTGSMESMLQDFQAKFKPILLGGTSDVSAIVYLESEMMFREKVLKMSRRKQNFNFTMIGSDTGEKFLPRLIMTAGFARGVRPSIKTEDHYRIIKPKEDSLIETILAMNSIKTSPTRKSAIAMDPLNLHFPAAIRSGRLKRMDLTNVVNACGGNSDTFSFSSTDMKQNFLESITSLLTELKYEAHISPSKMRSDRSSYEYKLSGSDQIFQRPMLSDGNNVIGTETIIKRGKVYYHNLIKFQHGSIIRNEDTDHDKYRHVDLSQELSHPVSIMLYYGYVCLMMDIRGKKEIVDVLGTSVKSLLKTFSIIVPFTLVNFDNVDELNLRKKSYDAINEYEHSPLELELGFYPDETESCLASVVGDDNDIAMFDEFSDGEDDDDIMNFLMSDGSADSDNEEAYESEGEGYFAESDEDSVYDEDRFSGSLARESGTSARYVLNQQKMISRSSIFYLNTSKAVKNIDRRKPPGKTKYAKVARGKRIYEISLPYDLSKSSWETTEDDDALMQIIADVSKDVDSTWKLDYLIETIIYSLDLAQERNLVGLE